MEIENLEDEFVKNIQENKKILHKLVFLYADTKEQQKDLQQEIMLQAWRSFPNFKGNSSFSTWLYKVALNVSLTSIKKNKRNKTTSHFSLEETENVQKTSISSSTDIDSEDQLKVVLNLFTLIDRTILVMNMEGYTHEEIAQTLGISLANARTKLFRIRKKVEEVWTY